MYLLFISSDIFKYDVYIIQIKNINPIYISSSIINNIKRDILIWQ